MSSPFTLLGPTGKVRVNGTAIGVASCRYRVRMDNPETTTTEDTPYKSSKLGNLVLEAEIVGYRQSDQPPHAAPISVGLKTQIALSISPNGTFDVSNSYISATFNVEMFEGDIVVSGSQPQGFQFSGRSTGAITIPSAV